MNTDGLSDYLGPTELVGEEEKLCVSEKRFLLNLIMLIHNELLSLINGMVMFMICSVNQYGPAVLKSID